MTSEPLPASAPAIGPDGTVVLRPSRTAYGRALRANLWIAIPLLVISLIRIGLNWWLLPFFVVVLLLTLGGVLLYFRTARVEYGGGSYTVVSMFGARRSFQASDAGSVVTVTSLLGASVQGGVAQLLVLGVNGAKILRLRGQTWEVDQFTALALDLMAHGVPNDAIREPITAAALRERYPRAVRWGEAHPLALGLMLGLGIVLVVVLAVAAMFFLIAS